MIKIEDVKTCGWDMAIHGMRNPLNSWNKSDSKISNSEFEIGKNDLDLMMRLTKAGTDHGKFMRMITVYGNITAPLYWWKEFDTYKVGTVVNSCSTMHKIQDHEFSFADFSTEKLDVHSLNHLAKTVELLNENREEFNICGDKHFWWQMIQMLPSSYNQKRTVMLNYEVLKNMYHARRSHKLDEWRELCKFIEKLPCSELITEN